MNPGSITFISAGAGSGKTTRLTEILEKKLIDREAEPDGIIATTFTNKAAAELRERVRGTLLEKNRQELATSIAEAQIGTVNSVCGSLLKRYAFELGLAMEQKVLDETSAMHELSRALDRAVGATELEEMTRLAERLGFVNARTGKALWKEHVKTIIDLARYNNIEAGQFDAFAEDNAEELLGLFPPSGEDGLEERVLSEIAALKPVIEQDLAGKPQKNTAAYLDELGKFERALTTDTFLWADWLKMVKEKPRKALHEATGKLGDLCGEVVSHPRLHSDIRDYLARIFSIAAATLDVYQRQKKEMGLVDFADQEALLLQGLDNPAVQVHLKERLDLLLVDEFQDTSPIQLALFLKLSSLARQTYWVGDVKQAIYGFRGGDAHLMQAVLRFLPDGSKEVLDRSWRSVPSLVGAANAVFCTSFAPVIGTKDIALEPEREEHHAQVSCFQWDLGKGAREEQYKAVAAGILGLVGEEFEVFEKKEQSWRKARYGDIAILARTNANVRKIAAVLKRNGIPAATVQPGLLASPETLLITAGLRRLVDPSDTLATAEIYSLVTCQNPEGWLENRLSYLQAGHDPDRWLEEGDDAHPVLAGIARLRERSLLFSPAAAVRALVSTTNAARHAMAWCRDGDAARERLLNMQTLVQLAGEYEEECANKGVSATLQGLVHWFAALAKDENDFFPEPPVNAVKILTVHKSKGLEWPVVVLLDLDNPGSIDVASPIVDNLQEVDAADPLKNRFIRFWPSPFGNSNPFAGLEAVLQSRVIRETEARSREEATRLLYVAMTRAKDCLILGASSKKTTLPWLEQAGADCLVKGDGKTVLLPDGARFPCIRKENLADEGELNSPQKERASLYWYPPKAPVGKRLPEQVLPSCEETVQDARVAEECVYSGSFDIEGNRSPSETGTAVHDILAFALTQEAGVCGAAAVERMLVKHGMANVCDPQALVRQLGQFRQKLFERWPNSTLFIEAPVEQRLPEKQVLKGQIDLLLETGNGWVVIDHKIMTLAPQEQKAKAIEYSGQLLAYKKALEEVTRKPVESCWIHFFAAGIMVCIDG